MPARNTEAMTDVCTDCYQRDEASGLPSALNVAYGWPCASLAKARANHERRPQKPLRSVSAHSACASQCRSRIASTQVICVLGRNRDARRTPDTQVIQQASCHKAIPSTHTMDSNLGVEVGVGVLQQDDVYLHNKRIEPKRRPQPSGRCWKRSVSLPKALPDTYWRMNCPATAGNQF